MKILRAMKLEVSRSGDLAFSVVARLCSCRMGSLRGSPVFVVFCVLSAVFSPSAAEGGTFTVAGVSYLAKAPRDERGVWVVTKDKPEADKFVPCVEAILESGVNIRSENTKIRAYFFNENRVMMGGARLPSPAFRTAQRKTNPFATPVIFYQNRQESVFFEVPKAISDSGSRWSVVVVFGDRAEVGASVFPGGALFGYEFPEKKLVFAGGTAKVKRTPIAPPVIEHVVHTLNSKHPKITLFLRFPGGQSDPAGVKGVLAMCVLANNVDEIRRKLENKNPSDYGLLFRFADKHNLAILCWGSQTIWRPDASYDELERETNMALDRGFDAVASAWERGVGELHEKYGLPTRDYLLWGVCGSAQWAHRLVLRKPDYFLAAYLHIPSSFDRPTPEAANVLWLLTAGELDGGYRNGARWYEDCRQAGYPIIFKAIVNLGHAGSPIADNLANEFFEYALALKGERDTLREQGQPASRPWPEGFRAPQFIGDYLNQQVFPADQEKMVPGPLRVALPTKKLAEAWDK